MACAAAYVQQSIMFVEEGVYNICNFTLSLSIIGQVVVTVAVFLRQPSQRRSKDRKGSQSTISAMIVTPVSYLTFRRSNFTRFFQVSTTPEISLRALEANRLQTTKYV
jgi:hypothetical protein